VFPLFQKKIQLQKLFELTSKLVFDQSADFFRYVKNQRDQILETPSDFKALTPSQEANAFYEIQSGNFSRLIRRS
jgi:hypothetical protein